MRCNMARSKEGNASKLPTTMRNPASPPDGGTTTTTARAIALCKSLLLLLAVSPSLVRAQVLVTTFPLRINSGAAAAIGPVVDRNGDTWATDAYFTTGYFDSTNRCTAAGTGPGPQCRIRSYNTAKNPAPYGYSIPVPNGQYRVDLHFVETFYALAGPFFVSSSFSSL
jgi:hypothetical protein